MAEPIAPRPAPDDTDGTAKTEVIAPAPTTTEVIEPVVVVQPAPLKKKRRWLGWVIALVVLLIVLIVGFFVADAFAKQYANGYVRERIIEVLKLDPDAQVDVDLGTGSVILQAIRGSIDEVSVHVDEITFGDLTGSADLTAASVPLDSTQPVEKLGIVVTVTEQNVRKLAGFLSGIDLKSIELQDGIIRIASEFDVFFFTVPVAVDLLPTANDGGINFDPQTVLLGDDEISVADLRASAEFRALAGDLLNSQQFCVANYLPEALVIDDVDVVGSNLVVSINGDGTALSDPALSQLGVCPAG
jgi:hypothetical protein